LSSRTFTILTIPLARCMQLSSVRSTSKPSLADRL
jgi:hypothetical protein